MSINNIKFIKWPVGVVKKNYKIENISEKDIFLYMNYLDKGLDIYNNDDIMGYHKICEGLGLEKKQYSLKQLGKLPNLLTDPEDIVDIIKKEKKIKCMDLYNVIMNIIKDDIDVKTLDLLINIIEELELGKQHANAYQFNFKNKKFDVYLNQLFMSAFLIEIKDVMELKNNLKKYVYPIIPKSYDWNGIMIAGGFVDKSIRGIDCKNTDVDIFIYGDDKQKVYEKLFAKIKEQAEKLKRKFYFYTKGKSVIEMYIEGFPMYQIVMTNKFNIFEVLWQFDFSNCEAAFDGFKTYGTPMFKLQQLTGNVYTLHPYLRPYRYYKNVGANKKLLKWNNPECTLQVPHLPHELFEGGMVIKTKVNTKTEINVFHDGYFQLRVPEIQIKNYINEIKNYKIYDESANVGEIEKEYIQKIVFENFKKSNLCENFWKYNMNKLQSNEKIQEWTGEFPKIESIQSMNRGYGEEEGCDYIFDTYVLEDKSIIAEKNDIFKNTFDCEEYSDEYYVIKRINKNDIDNTNLLEDLTPNQYYSLKFKEVNNRFICRNATKKDTHKLSFTKK